MDDWNRRILELEQEVSDLKIEVARLNRMVSSGERPWYCQEHAPRGTSIYPRVKAVCFVCNRTAQWSK